MTNLNPAPKRKPNILWLIVILIALIGLLVVAVVGLGRLAYSDDLQPTPTEQAASPSNPSGLRTHPGTDRGRGDCNPRPLKCRNWMALT